MAAAFCLRLAWGLIVCCLFLPRSIVPPRFFRVQYLAGLGLLVVAGFFLRDQADASTWLALGGSAVLCFLGSVVWHVDGSPGAGVLGWLSAGALSLALYCGGLSARDGDPSPWRNADDFAAGAVLGTATTSMLMGHSYLIAPAMSLGPLFRLLVALAMALALRAGLACFGLWLWTQSAQGALQGEMLIWLPARWALGIVGPLILGWMAWETTRLRSTQSATGILYVVTIVAFLGELTSLLLVERTGYLL